MDEIDIAAIKKGRAKEKRRRARARKLLKASPGYHPYPSDSPGSKYTPRREGRRGKKKKGKQNRPWGHVGF
jgi:hypothetical protein